MKKKYTAPPTTSLAPLLENGNDHAYRATVEAVWRTAQRISSMNERLAVEVGISPPQYSIIMAIAYSDGGSSIGAIADRIGVSQPFVTTEISKLVSAQMVVKKANPSDKRGVIVELSPKGKDAVVKLASMLTEINDILFQNVSRSDFNFLRKFFADVAQQADMAAAYIEMKLRRQNARR